MANRGLTPEELFKKIELCANKVCGENKELARQVTDIFCASVGTPVVSVGERKD